MNETQLKKIAEKYPFMSFCKYTDSYYIGIIQNSDNQIVSMYDYGYIPTQELRKHFLKCGDTWWWESNRQIPINIFLLQDFKVFRPFLKTFAKKEFEIIMGPSVSLNETMLKRTKRRQITLVKKV